MSNDSPTPNINDEDSGLLLARCLDDIEAGRATVQACMASYPALAPALRMSARLRELPPAPPDPVFRAVSRQRLLNVIAARSAAETVRLAEPQPAPAPAVPARRPLWRSLAWQLTAALVVVSLLGGGTVLAAGESLPDEPLYPVKLAAERVQVVLTPLEERRFDVLLNQSDRRLLEATAMAMAGKYERAYLAMIAYEAILRDMERAGLSAANRGRDIAPLVAEFQTRAVRQQAGLQRALNNTPPRTRQVVARLIAVVTAAQEDLVKALTGVPGTKT